MSYDLAVWVGQRPQGDAEALREFERLYEEWMARARSDVTIDRSPEPAIQNYVEALLQRWPDIDSDEGDESPWSNGPLIGDASGPLLYFGMVYGMADEATRFAAEVAAERGLVCFDPQTKSLR